MRESFVINQEDSVDIVIERFLFALKNAGVKVNCDTSDLVTTRVSITSPPKTYASTDHALVYPTDGASVAVASDAAEAHKLIKKALKEKGLHKKKFTVREIKPGTAEVLADGDY